MTEEGAGIKALSLTCDVQPLSTKREKRIISSVLFEYQPHGAYIHYFAITDMKQSKFNELFVIKESKNVVCFEEYVSKTNPYINYDRAKYKDGVLLHLDNAEDDSIVMRGKGLGRFMLHLLQVLSFCRNDTFELHLKSSKESVQFYKECNFFKGKFKVLPTKN